MNLNPHTKFGGEKEKKMIKTKKRMFVFSLVVCLFISVTSMVVYAESNNCKKVRIYIINAGTEYIKVTKVAYKDFNVNKWRIESTWATLKIAPRSGRGHYRTLEHVKGDPTIVRILYRRKTGFLRWSGVILMQSQRFICRDHCQVKFVVE